MDKTAVLDLSEALSRADGDQDLFLTLATLFLQESPKEAAAVRAALERQDCAVLTAAAHKLKGSVMRCAHLVFLRARNDWKRWAGGESLLRPRRSVPMSRHA
jgi:hypothetical protein